MGLKQCCSTARKGAVRYRVRKRYHRCDTHTVVAFSPPLSTTFESLKIEKRKNYLFQLTEVVAEEEG